MTESGGEVRAGTIEDPISLGGLTKLLAALAGAAYATGVVAINTYLHGLGIVDFSFAKPKLLLTGALVMGTFFLLAASPIFLAWGRLERLNRAEEVGLQSKPPWEILALGLFSLTLLGFCAFAVCFRLSTGLGQIQQWWVWEHLKPQVVTRTGSSALIVALHCGAVGVAAASGYRAMRFFRIAQSRAGHAANRLLIWVHFSIALAFLLASVVGYILLFAFVFYPSVPVEFGGGKPYFESFAVSDDKVCEWKQIGLPFEKNSPNVTKPLPVLHESDTLVAVWLSQNDKELSAEKVAAPDENKHGFSKLSFMAVQLDKSGIVATKGYPHWKAVPELVQFVAPCPAAAALSVAPAQDEKAK